MRKYLVVSSSDAIRSIGFEPSSGLHSVPDSLFPVPHTDRALCNRLSVVRWPVMSLDSSGWPEEFRRTEVPAVTRCKSVHDLQLQTGCKLKSEICPSGFCLAAATGRLTRPTGDGRIP